MNVKVNDSIEKQFEGLELVPYKDIGGVWTNGYGNTHNVIPNGPAITVEQAESDLQNNLQSSLNTINTLVKVPLTQNQTSALVDFVFNLGSGNFKSSTLLKLLNEGNYVGASGQFQYWNHDNGVVVAGLTRRRSAEETMFNTPD